MEIYNIKQLTSMIKNNNMYWNFRVLAFVKGGVTVLKICEVYYDDKNKPSGYTDQNTISSTDGSKGLKWLLSKYRQAIKKPILHGDDKFPSEYIEHI